MSLFWLGIAVGIGLCYMTAILSDRFALSFLRLRKWSIKDDMKRHKRWASQYKSQYEKFKKKVEKVMYQ